MVGAKTVVFQHDRELYLAPLSGVERPVARAELPLGGRGVRAWTPLPRRQRESEIISSLLVAAPHGNAVAFPAAAGESTDPVAAQRAHGTKTVFLLRPGAQMAVELRQNLSAYDASYVALAERLGCGLLTADARLSRARGIRCPVTVVPG